MAINKSIKSTTKNSPAIHTGANSNNKPASDYAKPHTMSGKSVSVEAMNKAVSHEMYSNQGYPVAGDVNAKTPTAVVSIGANKGQNMNGSWEFRGAGAAVKGRKSYGPLA